MATIYTIGHSVRHLEKFIGVLKHNNVTMVVDVRTVPHSEHNPQFNETEMEKQMPRFGLKYDHMKSLGGYHDAKSDSINLGWEDLHFRGFADYMQTPEFYKAIEELIELAKHNSIVIMCSEGDPFRCHRLLISDALHARGIKVIHITSGSEGHSHVLTSFAKVSGHNVTYPKYQE